MNISGIRTYAGFYDYNTIKNPKVRVEPEEIMFAEQRVEQTEQEAVVEHATTPEQPDCGAVNYAKKYEPDATYELKGIDSDITNLDVEKALSDMSKDKVLQQYQFFVGERNAGDVLSEQRKQESFYL